MKSVRKRIQEDRLTLFLSLCLPDESLLPLFLLEAALPVPFSRLLDDEGLDLLLLLVRFPLLDGFWSMAAISRNSLRLAMSRAHSPCYEKKKKIFTMGINYLFLSSNMFLMTRACVRHHEKSGRPKVEHVPLHIHDGRHLKRFFSFFFIYFVLETCGTAGAQQDPRQFPPAHGGGDVQRRVPILFVASKIERKNKVFIGQVGRIHPAQ